jgi:hypothetical protein
MTDNYTSLVQIQFLILNRFSKKGKGAAANRAAAPSVQRL